MDLTIIIPARDRNDRVVECVLALAHNEADIIVVDDGSREPIALPSNCGRVIRHNRHRGRPAAINTALREARYDTVLVMNDNICASPHLVVRLKEEFATRNDSKLALAPRVMWHPDLPVTMTMRWMEDVNRFPGPILLSKSFVLAHGGYDEGFSRRSEDLELQLRLKQHGFEWHTVASAVGFRHDSLRIRDLVEREFMDGVSAVFLHSKFPDFMPQIDDLDALVRNEKQDRDAEAAVDEISLLEQSGSNVLPTGASELYVYVCRYYFLHGVFEGLKDIGDVNQRRPNAAMVSIYKYASFLESIGEFDEAKRLFRLVRDGPDEDYWDGAEYHMGCIENELGKPAASHSHFLECLRCNPAHTKARRIINYPTMYREVDANVFEIIEPAVAPRLLFVLFGGLSNVVTAFPVVSALRERFHCETGWLTSADYAPLVKASLADVVYEGDRHAMMPWDWIHSQRFTHIFFAEPEANRDEWQQSGLHPIDFMARKCGVKLQRRRIWLQPNAEAIFEAEEFLRQHGLTRGTFVTASLSEGSARHWPNSNLRRLAQQHDTPTVVFGKKNDQEISGTIACIEKPLQVIAALIRWSCFYLGPASGISWLATTTDTPMAVIFDPLGQAPGFRQTLQEERDDIQEWDIYTGLETVLTHVESKLDRLNSGLVVTPAFS